MEIGEIDLNALLQDQLGKPISLNFIRHIWEQVSCPLCSRCFGLASDHGVPAVWKMLQAVQVVHDANIVHTDLKPANFVLVKGSLKLIDFGIAKAIPNDTTNIKRDQQVSRGLPLPTMRYMVDRCF